MTLAELLPIATKLLYIKPNCQACGMGTACCGCPAERNYYAQYNPLANKYGKEQLDAVLAYAAAKTVATNKAAELKRAEEKCNQLLKVCTSLGIQ